MKYSTLLAALLMDVATINAVDPPPMRSEPSRVVAEPPAMKSADPPPMVCICGTECVCKPGVCPAKCPVVASRPLSYGKLTERVQAGETLTLAVGVEDKADGYVAVLQGFAPGVYDCFLYGGQPSMRIRPKAEFTAQPDCKTGNCNLNRR